MFYGCSYPEIWKLSSACASGLLLIGLAITFFVAKSKSPFVKIKEQLPVDPESQKLQSGHTIIDPNWSEMETLSIVILQ